MNCVRSGLSNNHITIISTMINYSRFLLAMVLILLPNIGMCQTNGCRGRDLRCGRHGPLIRFPFRLKDSEPDHCGYPGFDLTCSHEHDTLLQLPALPDPIELRVTNIDYQNRVLYLSDPENCLPRQFAKLNQSSIAPFHFPQSESNNITLLTCDSVPAPQFPERLSCKIYAYYSADGFLSRDLLSCTKFSDISSSLNPYGLNLNNLKLTWSKPDCSECETKGKMCKLKSNGTEDNIECFDRDAKPIKKIILDATGVIGGSIMLVLVLMASFGIYRYFRVKGEDQTRIERFLEDYRAFNPTRFSYADIKRITNNFKEKLGEGAHGAVFKGKLSNEILVAVKILNNTEGDGREFINEVEAMGKIHHVNVVRLLGFCADGFYRALVYNFFPNGSLQNFISPLDDKDRFLGWEKLQQIALGIAKGIEYLHQGCDHRILHFDINPHNVLLDDKLIPKISDFGLAKLCSKNQSMVSITAARGTLGYIAPEVFSRNFGNVSYKSDIYSYGMLLLEMVGGRKNISLSSEETFQVLYPEWIHNLLEGRDIHITIEGTEDHKIVKKLAIVGLWCIQWHSVNRPSMKTVLQMLEALEEDKLTVPPSPFDSTSISSTSAIMSAKSSGLELEVIHE